MIYEQSFERNLGIFTPEEQSRIRHARVVLVGCGGIGGVIALALARSGLEHFVLYDDDVYTVSNLNRQITCYNDTLGDKKVLSIREAILNINPLAEVEVCTEALRPESIGDAIAQGDVFIPAADDWALSIASLNQAKDMGKPAIMAYPVGALGRVCTFLPDSPYAAECLVMPYKFPYSGLKTFMDDPNNRRVLQYYQTEGAWRQEWFDDWCEGKRQHPQMCVMVWITGALAAMEVIKLVSKKWPPVAAPHYWKITPTGAGIARFGLARRLLSRYLRRPNGAALLPALVKRPRLVRLFTRALQ